MLEKLKKEVCEANIKLVEYNLVTFTWGNVSGIDREKHLMVIKPSGILYSVLQPEDMVVVDFEGNIVEGNHNASIDAPTHLYLYKEYHDIGGITHTHSLYATSWAQSGLHIPALGTTHADNFYGDIPCTEEIKIDKIKHSYEYETGAMIVQTFKKFNLTPQAMPAILCNNHGPFTFGKNAIDSVNIAKILEVVSQMAFQTYCLNQRENKVSQLLLDKHYFRKHGKNAYYGQINNK